MRFLLGRDVAGRDPEHKFARAPIDFPEQALSCSLENGPPDGQIQPFASILPQYHTIK